MDYGQFINALTQPGGGNWGNTLHDFGQQAAGGWKDAITNAMAKHQAQQQAQQQQAQQWAADLPGMVTGALQKAAPQTASAPAPQGMPAINAPQSAAPQAPKMPDFTQGAGGMMPWAQQWSNAWRNAGGQNSGGQSRNTLTSPQTRPIQGTAFGGPANYSFQ